MLLNRVRCFLLVLLTGLLLGCSSGDDSDDGGGQVSQPSTTTTTGALAVIVNNLPAGGDAPVRVAGPDGFARELGRSETLADLAPGSYTVSAHPVVIDGQTYIPSPETRRVEVLAGNTAGAAFAYSTNTARIALREVASGLASPTFLAAPSDDERLFIVERAGRIRILQNGDLLAEPFLDISQKTDTSGEGGLLSMAFDPAYAQNGHFYVFRTDLEHDIVVERYTVSEDPDEADPESTVGIIQIAHPLFQIHFGGQLAFGPDGYLYIGTGDGGAPGDVNGNAQNLNSLLGKILRLDVSAASFAEPYRIPASNPYANESGRRGEIWAYGLRNPWRFSFDGARLYIGDVGQERREEIDLASASQGGINYGWNRMEGGACYESEDCDQEGLALPILDYEHGSANALCSVTGGYVYRGADIPELTGRYFYSDFCAGFLRSFYASGGVAYEQRDWDVENLGRVVSFGQDGQGELYLLTLGGTVWRLERAAQP